MNRPARFKTLFAPTEGLDSTSPIANLSEKKAYTLDNLIPYTGSVQSRKGRTLYATGVGVGLVNSLFELKAAAINKFIAGTQDGAFYDISIAGLATLIQGGFTNNPWQACVFNGSLGLVNGVDTPQVYNGTTMVAMTVSGPSDVTKLNNILTFKFRTYFSLVNSQSFWYSGLNTLGGALMEFPLNNVGSSGGNLIGMQVLATKDGGAGPLDLICFFMSTGEVIIYSGTNPGADFVLVGVYKSGRPISAKGIIKFGADILTITNEGYIPMSAYLPLAYGKSDNKLSKDIEGAALAAIQSASTFPGWEATLAPFENLLVINVPTNTDSFVQHVLNTNTLHWCTFSGFSDTFCWANYGNNLFCGGNGEVYQYGPNYADYDPSDASYDPILCTYTSGYFELGKRPLQITAMRPRLTFDGALNFSISYSSDFKAYTIPVNYSYGGIGAHWGTESIQGTDTPWNTSLWQVTNATQEWLAINTLANNFSFKTTFSVATPMDLFGFNLLFKDGTRI